MGVCGCAASSACMAHFSPSASLLLSYALPPLPMGRWPQYAYTGLNVFVPLTAVAWPDNNDNIGCAPCGAAITIMICKKKKMSL